MAERTPGVRGLHLLDVSALVVGYGLASMLIRRILARLGTPETLVR